MSFAEAVNIVAKLMEHTFIFHRNNKIGKSPGCIGIIKILYETECHFILNLFFIYSVTRYLNISER